MKTLRSVMMLVLVASAFGFAQHKNEVAIRAYSNAQYSDEGGDWTGCDLELRQGDGASGYIVFYESFWYEPTLVKLEMTDLRIQDSVATFKLSHKGFSAEYKLEMHDSRATLIRTDLAGAYPVSLTRPKTPQEIRKRIKKLAQ
jgi:hypothetical protein